MNLLFHAPYSPSQRILQNLSLKYIQNFTSNHSLYPGQSHSFLSSIVGIISSGFPVLSLHRAERGILSNLAKSGYYFA